MPSTSFRLIKGLLFTALSVAAASSHAGLVLLGPQTQTGTGLGAVNTVLTVQSPGNSTTESGSVSFNGTSDVITGDAKTGASQTNTYSLGSLGVTQASDLRIVFNASQPGGSAINLDNLVLDIFSPTGTRLFTSGAFQPITFPATTPGTGKSDFVFGLDQSSIAAASSVFSGNFAADRVGLTAALSNARGGLETFFLTADASTRPGGGGNGGGGGANGGGTGNAVPEPASMALLGVGLLAMGALYTRKRG